MTDLFPDLLLTDPVTLDQTEAYRVKRVVKLSAKASERLLPSFKAYQGDWNDLVRKDRSGEKLKRQSPIQREYLNRRKLTTNPLRVRSWSRTVSIPLSAELRRVVKESVRVDWRRVTKARLCRFGSTVALSYVETVQVAIQKPLPMMFDVGMTLTEEGLFVRLQAPTDEPLSQFIPKIRLTKQFFNQMAQRMRGRVRLVALDPLIPPSMTATKNLLVRKMRNAQAEGATVFRTPRRVSLGEKYLNQPKGSHNRLTGPLRGFMKEWAGYSLILGLTGEPLLVKECGGRLVTGPMDKSVHPIVRANDVLQTALAKLGLWHTAPSLPRRDSQRVRRAFHRLLLRTVTTID